MSTLFAQTCLSQYLDILASFAAVQGRRSYHSNHMMAASLCSHCSAMSMKIQTWKDFMHSLFCNITANEKSRHGRHSVACNVIEKKIQTLQVFILSAYFEMSMKMKNIQILQVHIHSVFYILPRTSSCILCSVMSV